MYLKRNGWYTFKCKYTTAAFRFDCVPIVPLWVNICCYWCSRKYKMSMEISLSMCNGGSSVKCWYCNLMKELELYTCLSTSGAASLEKFVVWNTFNFRRKTGHERRINWTCISSSTSSATSFGRPKMLSFHSRAAAIFSYNPQNLQYPEVLISVWNGMHRIPIMLEEAE